MSKNWHSEVIAGGYRAVIFDCDGTLVNSSEAHFQSFRAAVRAQGHNLDRSWYEERTGLDRRSLLSAFAAETSGKLDVPLAIQQSIDAFIGSSKRVFPIHETMKLVHGLHPSHPMAVGTNAEVEVATASLCAVNLFDYFETIVSISDGLPAKPAPDIFIQAMQRLGVSAAQTLIFEDSEEGIRAAITAGSDAIQVTVTAPI